MSHLVSSFSLLLFTTTILFLHSIPQCASQMQTYIVHVDSPPHTTTTSSQSDLDDEEPQPADLDEERKQVLEAYYRTFFHSTSTTESDADSEQRVVYSYHNVLSGFAAKLTEQELADMRTKPGFIHAYPDIWVTLETTYTPAFLGLNLTTRNFWSNSSFGRGVIIGFLDSGVMPDHPSFNPQDMPTPPPKWKGKCEFKNSSLCNNKLIGARVFLNGALVNATNTSRWRADEPVDIFGHGTHTSSTAGGQFVDNASALGSAAGTAVGMAPFAHVAVYRVCPEGNCKNSDILAGLDAAVSDGVDIISVSLGGPVVPLYENALEIGAFGAMEKGVLVCLAAGNAGPNRSTIANDAPWVMTVGASTTDRVIRTTVKLGNNAEYDGKSLFQSNDSSPLSPLIYPGAINLSSKFCDNGSLANIDVRGKVVVCDLGGITGRIAKGFVVKNAGGKAMILANSPERQFSIASEAHLLPASYVTFADALNIKAYINQTSSTNNAAAATTTTTAAIIPKGTLISGIPPSPMVAAFSSRGPAVESLGILKPDIVGPGVDVLAAWPNLPIGPSTIGSLFNVESGTSMATPHVSGIAGLLKSAHPNWSPAMIKSAIMTTADVNDNSGKPIADHTLQPASVFAIGAGHVNPKKANRPGLVYDTKPDEYISYMCGISLTDAQVSAVARRQVNCSNVKKIFDAELNYPSFSITLGPANNFTRSVVRTVTNVEGQSSYSVEVVNPKGVMMKIVPDKLEFAELNEQKSYSVEFTVSGADVKGVEFSQGSLRWVSLDQKTSVRSPVAITFQ